jgi:hypothetical protein
MKMIICLAHDPLTIGERWTCRAEEQLLNDNKLMAVQFMQVITHPHAHQTVQTIHGFLLLD